MAVTELPAPLIELHGVAVERGAAPVLAAVDLQLMPGERLVVAGPNGAGKTTLLRTLIGLEKAAAGEVRLLGAACTSEADFRRVRPRIGFLFQDSDDQLFSPTVIEDVAFGPMNQGLTAKAALDKAQATLERLQLSHLADRITYRLSGGEKRLVCLAGLIAMEPEVLLLDEPTNGLDGANAERLKTILHSIKAAMIVVSHDHGFLATLATRAVLLERGTVVDAVMHRHPHAHDHVHIHAAGNAAHHRL
jgi:cobalt/nickel transport system ATP-binding protein